jgi:hypothetical protein
MMMNRLRMQSSQLSKVLGWFIVSLSVFVTACPRNGPSSVVRDRFDYNTAISGSMKDQMLLNIVKLHDVDLQKFNKGWGFASKVTKCAWTQSVPPAVR